MLIIFIEQVWENFTFDIQQFALFDLFSISYYQMTYFFYVICDVNLHLIQFQFWFLKSAETMFRSSYL